MQQQSAFRKFLGSKMMTLLIMLAVLIAIFTIWSEAVGNSFLRLSTLVTILSSIVVTSFLAVGASFLMVSGNIDLSASSIGAFGGMFTAAAIFYWHFPWWLAIILALVCCGAFGAFNAVLVNEFRFQPFIATMAMSSVIKGIMMFVSIDQNAANPTATTINFTNKAISWIGSYQIFGKIPFTIIFTLLAFIIYGVILSKTRFGMKVYLVGGNPMAANLVGINPKKISYTLFINSAVLGGVSGVMLTCRTLQGNAQALMSNMFTGLTAAMLGGISFGGGSGGMGGAFVGMLILNTFTQGMATVNFSPYWTTILSGLLLIFALTLDILNQRRVMKVKV
ncbi:MAG: ABC transporter permease [Clostridiales bacterium]|nr:ABC transporter permease [Clostridiales bacterium]